MDVEVQVSTLLAVTKGFYLFYVVVLLKQLLPIQITNLASIQGLVTASIYNAAIPLRGF